MIAIPTRTDGFVLLIFFIVLIYSEKKKELASTNIPTLQAWISILVFMYFDFTYARFVGSIGKCKTGISKLIKYPHTQ